VGSALATEVRTSATLVASSQVNRPLPLQEPGSEAPLKIMQSCAQLMFLSGHRMIYQSTLLDVKLTSDR